ncbi:hypothetical protein DRJ25_02520 [Candidatus Woesearchaeota archaeon]|nr:MAG: hypothetical protein DRJ25_02520 [Candidatus Woesearchaeota archaeon]
MARKKTNWFPIIAILMLGVIGLMAMGVIQIPMKVESKLPGPQPQPTPQPTEDICKETATTTLKINVYNPLNTSGSENYDVTLYGFVDGSLTYTVTDTTNPSGITVNCGEEIVFKAVGTDGASGDKSFIEAASGSGGDIKVVDGNLVVRPTKSTMTVNLQIEQHATLECRAYDNVNEGLMYNSDDASNTDYEPDGVVWTSVNGNSTAYSEADGVDITFTCRAIQSDTDYNDRGIWVLIEAPSSVWDEPTVSLNGRTLSEASALLNEDERKAYSDYEYVYFIPEDTIIRDGGEGMKLRVQMELLDGVSAATSDPEIDFAVRTQYKTTDGLDVKIGAVDDSSSTSQIIALYDMTLDVT